MDPGTERDEYVMAQVRQGRMDQLEILVRRHASGLLTFLTRMLGDRHRAEEQFQEVFLSVWLKRQQYQYPRPFRPWLYAIAMNRCRATFRLKTPHPDPLESEPIDPGSSPADRLLAAETAEQISRAVTQLPTQQRAVVVLRIWQGLGYSDIAKQLGCTEGTVRSHMHHALAALHDTLQPLAAAQLAD
jgi:RNA polymerase sigma-70 factor (ECF subfamily)